MAKIMNAVAISAAVAFVAIAQCAHAQDDLDDLLKDLEGGAKAKPAEKAQAESVPDVKAEVAAPVAEAAPAPAAPVAEAAPAAPAAEAAPASAAPATEVAAEPAPASNEKINEINNLLSELAAESAPKKSAAPANESAEAAPVAAAPAAEAAPAVAKPANPDAELLANISATQKLRRQALDSQAAREIAAARECMDNGEYTDAVSHYGAAAKLLNDRPASRQLRKECDQGIAEGLYRAALQEEDLGRRDRAVKLMEGAMDMRHPKARRTLEKWLNEGEKVEQKADLADIKHRRNDDEFKNEREQIRKHLRRSRQLLAVRDMDKALEEVEVVLVNDPYNQEAIRLRGQIQKKRQTILKQEREAARDGMIADVDEAWRPVYAVNAAQLNETSAETVKAQLGDDPERTQEQDIERRMKEMRLPTISFKPPATIMDAVEFFRQASKDYDRPDIPIEKRGFNFVLKTPQVLTAQAAAGGQAAEADDFSANANGGDEQAGGQAGMPMIPTITASDITFYEALKLVCDSVEYKFIIRGPVVMVMHKDMSTAELLSRKYHIPEAFVERVNTASEEMKSMGGFGNSNKAKQNEEAEEGEGRDWKAFFEEMGVKWPEGSSIKHIKALGKLYVRNTRENLAEFEKVLDELGGQPQLIEIETRFVEVSQEDLNSLGFEWILNSDYSLNLGNSLGRALGIQNGVWGSESGSKSWDNKNSTDFGRNINGRNGGGQWYAGGGDGWENTTTSDSRLDPSSSSVGLSRSSDIGHNAAYQSRAYSDSYARSEVYNSKGANWISGNGDSRNIGVNAFGGTSDYNNGNRYLSTMGNHISGESRNTNDQFMRVNAFLGTADLSMILHMLSQRSDTDLLSAPKVVTKSGEQAIIKVVTEYIYPQDYDVQLQSSSSSGSSSSGGGSSSAILAVVEPQNFTMREVGVILDVTPTYSEANGGTIDLELKPQVVEEPTWKNYGMKIPFTGNPAGGTPSLDWIISIGPEALNSMSAAVKGLIDANADTIAGQYVDAGIQSMNPNTITYYDAPMEQPFFSVRSIDSKVSIAPGSTVVMGGLITEQRKAMDDKVPFLGDLPCVGRLFRSHAEQTIKRNLLIFVTGRLITPSGRELKMNVEPNDDAEVKAAPKAE